MFHLDTLRGSRSSYRPAGSIATHLKPRDCSAQSIGQMDLFRWKRYSSSASNGASYLTPTQLKTLVHYDRAPIAEAIIDIQASFESSPSLEDLEKFSRSLGDRLPLVHAINSFAVNFAADAENGGLQSNATAAQLGYRLSSQANDRILQVRKEGLSYSHMPPYSNWDQFVGEVQPLWNQYAETFAAKSLNRLAVRFINRLQIESGVDVDSYLSIGPRIPDAVSTHVIGFFTQLVLPVMDLGPEYKAIINIGVEPGTAPNVTGLLLDIDVFCEQSVQVEGDQMWDVLQKLRNHKNKIFEASITEKTREMIK